MDVLIVLPEVGMVVGRMKNVTVTRLNKTTKIFTIYPRTGGR